MFYYESTCLYVSSDHYVFHKIRDHWFWGPVALVGYMQRDLVEKRNWITGENYKEGLALAQLAPGPSRTGA